METVGERIKFIRKQENLTQEQFSKKIGLKRASLSNVECCKNGITKSGIKLICILFSINPDWLTTGQGEMHTTSPACTKMEATNMKTPKDYLIEEILKTELLLNPDMNQGREAQLTGTSTENLCKEALLLQDAVSLKRERLYLMTTEECIRKEAEKNGTQ